MNNVDDMIASLLDMVEVKDDWRVDFTPEAKELIHEIAVRCSDIEIVKDTVKRAEEYAKDLSAEEVCADMLIKIANAPTRIHTRMVARMLIPVLDKKLQEGGEKDAESSLCGKMSV